MKISAMCLPCRHRIFYLLRIAGRMCVNTNLDLSDGMKVWTGFSWLWMESCGVFYESWNGSWLPWKEENFLTLYGHIFKRLAQLKVIIYLIHISWCNINVIRWFVLLVKLVLLLDNTEMWRVCILMILSGSRSDPSR